MTKFNHRTDLRGMAYDAARSEDDASALMKSDGSPLVDSAKAHRILCGCVGRLSSDDVMSVADMLKNADLIDSGELAALKTAMTGSDDDSGADPMGAMDKAARASRRRRSAEDDKAFGERFPYMDRIKQAW